VQYRVLKDQTAIVLWYSVDGTIGAKTFAFRFLGKVGSTGEEDDISRTGYDLTKIRMRNLLMYLEL
jgi:hypothetical protein